MYQQIKTNTMDSKMFLNELKSILSDFNLQNTSSIGSVFGTKTVPRRFFIDSKKNTINVLGIRHIYISGIMGSSEKKFIYCTVHTTSQMRGYRRKRWFDEEYNKVFISAKDYSEMLIKIKSRLKEINE